MCRNMAAQQAVHTCDCASMQAEEGERLSEFPEAHRARPSLQGQGWARDHWFRLQSVVDRIKVLQKEARVKRGKGKAIFCVFDCCGGGGGKEPEFWSGCGGGRFSASGDRNAAGTVARK